jgi:hypothetical protein
VNFAQGANPPRAEWKIPPQKSAEESRVAYETFEAYIRHIKSRPRVRFVTASEALALYADSARTREFSAGDVAAIAKVVATQAGESGVSFVRRDEFALSAAEALWLLNEAARRLHSHEPLRAIRLTPPPFGPSLAPVEHETVTAPVNQLERTVADVSDYMRRHGRVPNAVWLGSTPISPESYLRALAEHVARLLEEPASLPREARFAPTSLAAASFVADDNPRLWGWVIFPPNFRAPEMMALAKRQAWTLKPAVLSRQ